VIKQVNIEMLIISFLLLWAVSCTSSVKEEKIPATTDSESARLLFLRADAIFEKVYISEAVEIDSTWTGSLRKSRRARTMINTDRDDYFPIK